VEKEIESRREKERESERENQNETEERKKREREATSHTVLLLSEFNCTDRRNNREKNAQRKSKRK
jgi:hypothetical protein